MIQEMKNRENNDIEPELLHCNQCKHHTRHICQASYVRNRYFFRENLIKIIDEPGNPEAMGFEETISRFWICAGCEQTSLEITYTNSGMYDRDGNQEYNVRRLQPAFDIGNKEYSRLPVKLKIIYQEVLEAFENQLYLLCCVGIRALIEGICSNKNVSGSNLLEKIEGLKEFLPDNIVDHLHSLRFMGNEAAHDLSMPTSTELQLAIEICEDLLNYLYSLDYKTSYLTELRKKS